MSFGNDNQKYAAIMAAINAYVAQLRAKEVEKKGKYGRAGNNRACAALLLLPWG